MEVVILVIWLMILMPSKRILDEFQDAQVIGQTLAQIIPDWILWTILWTITLWDVRICSQKVRYGTGKVQLTS